MGLWGGGACWLTSWFLPSSHSFFSTALLVDLFNANDVHMWRSKMITTSKPPTPWFNIGRIFTWSTEKNHKALVIMVGGRDRAWYLAAAAQSWCTFPKIITPLGIVAWSPGATSQGGARCPRVNYQLSIIMTIIIISGHWSRSHITYVQVIHGIREFHAGSKS